MERRTLLGAVAGSGAAAAGGVALFKPAVIVGSPRGEGEPISTEHTTFEGSVEYQPESETVRWSRAENPDGPEDYTTEPFEDWASRRAGSAGAEAARAAARERVDGKVEGLGRSISHEYIGLVVILQLVTLRDGEGAVETEPNISLDTLVGATPRSVEVTVRLSGRSYTETMPVFADEVAAAMA